MDSQPLEGENWYAEVEDFFVRWNEEADSIKEKVLDSIECSAITKMYHKNQDDLLLRRPVDLADQTLMRRFEELDNKIQSSLAMALCTKS